jgi:hypothetical protein
MVSINDIVREVRLYEDGMYIEWESVDSDVLIREYKRDGSLYVGYRFRNYVIGIYGDMLVGYIS